MTADDGPQLTKEKATLSSFFRIRPRTFFPLSSSTQTSKRMPRPGKAVSSEHQVYISGIKMPTSSACGHKLPLLRLAVLFMVAIIQTVDEYPVSFRHNYERRLVLVRKSFIKT